MQDVEIDRGGFRGVLAEKRETELRIIDLVSVKNENPEVLKGNVPRARRRSPRVSV